MFDEARFGLPLSLVEALRVDPSAKARELADLLSEGDRPAPQPGTARNWRRGVAGLMLCMGLGTQSLASAANLEGRWIMTPASSSFQEAVTGPAPDTAVVTVTRDDANALTYELVESRKGVEVARGAYEISFAGADSTSSVDGAKLQVAASRDAAGAVLIVAPAVRGLQASIHMQRTGPDTALLEHDITTPEGSLKVEKISLVRTSPVFH